MNSQRIDCYFSDKQSLLNVYAALHDHKRLEECLKSNEYDVNNGNCFVKFTENEEPLGGWTPLHISAYNNDTKSAALLLKFGANINSRTGDPSHRWYTPLHIAIMRKSRQMVKFLCESKADINAKDSNRMTPIELCIRSPELSVILVKSGVDYQSGRFLNYPLIFRAMDEKNLKLVDLLAKDQRKGVYYNNRSAIAYAFDEFPECVPSLINSGIQIHFADTETGDYPIHVAIRKSLIPSDLNSIESNDANLWIQMLCQKKCNLNVMDTNGNRPLHIAVQKNCSVELALFLIRYGANPNLKNKLGLTPICYAIQNGFEDLILLLLEYKTQLSRNLSELERAFSFKKFNSAAILLESIETIDSDIEFNSEPIIWFFVRQSVGEHNSNANDMTIIMQNLIDKTSGVNSIDSVWGTLMHYLIYADVCSPTHCFKPMFRTLIRSLKCDINYEFKPKDTQLNGEEVPVANIVANGTALSFALERNETHFYAEELIRVGADTSTIIWDNVFFAPNKAKSLKMLIHLGCVIPDSFRVDSNPIYDESIHPEIVPHYCSEFDKFIKWWDKRQYMKQFMTLTLKQLARNVIRKSIGNPNEYRHLAERDPTVFSPQFETFPKCLTQYLFTNCFEDFED